MTCCFEASFAGRKMAACLTVVEASAYLSSSSVLQFLPYNSSTYLRTVSNEMISEDVPSNSDSYWTKSMCSTNFVKTARLPILNDALVVRGFDKLKKTKNPRKTRKWVSGSSPNSIFFVAFSCFQMFPKKTKKWIGGLVFGV